MTIDEILAEAIADFEEHGFDSEERLAKWERLIREALYTQMRSQAELDRMLREHLQAVYARLIQKGRVLSKHPGVSKFTLANIAPRLHSELSRRILASAQLIKLNRENMINKTMQRFSGWASSVPKGGTENVDKRKLKQEISKPLKSLPFVERRVLIDQGHKLTSSINAVVAHDSGAIAARWFSHWRQSGYNYRDDHKERDGHVYLIRDSWATKAGLVKVGKFGWADEITQPGEEVFCRCSWTYIYALRKLPEEMLTAKGKEALKQSRAA